MPIGAQDFEKALSVDFLRGLHEGQRDKSAAARWASVAEITSKNWLYGSRPGMLFLGYRNGVRIGRHDDRHMVTIGGTRAGKGVSLINPNLLTYEGSVIAIDPKGELAKVTALPRRKRLAHTCHVLDPFKTSGLPSASFNPLAEIKKHVAEVPEQDWPYAIDDAASIADALIVSNRDDSHWSDSAKSLVQALILWALLLRVDEQDHLLTVRDFLMLRDASIIRSADEEHGGDREKALFSEMLLYASDFNKQISSVGAQFLSMGEKERAGVLSEARTQTAFLDSPALQDVLTKSDFTLADLKQKNTTVYLCLPASNMGTHAKWLRTIITLALRSCERVPLTVPHPVLFVLDEFAVLGHMKAIESAAGQMAGFGVKLWTILQDLSQLKHHYKDSWETFFGNASIATFHGISDMTTLKYLSERLGNRSFNVALNTGVSVSASVQGASLTQENIQHQPLAATHELELALAREFERVVVLYSGSHPMVLQRSTYYADPFFREKMQ